MLTSVWNNAICEGSPYQLNSQRIKMKEGWLEFSNRIITEAISSPEKAWTRYRSRASCCLHPPSWKQSSETPHINASHIHVVCCAYVFSCYARCVNDCSHGNQFPLWVKDIDGKSRHGRGGWRGGWRGGGLVNLVAGAEIYFSWGSCSDRVGSSRIQSSIFWLKVPDLRWGS